MADRPALTLTYSPGACPDCGTRRAVMPPLPVAVPDDIDLTARDFEAFRRLMLESLALDNPDRERWSEADLEVTLVELLAAALDRQSHAIDALFAERFLQTARWPRSVVRHLAMIDGVAPAMDAMRALLRDDEIARFRVDDTSATAPSQAEVLFDILDTHPQLLETAKAAALAQVNRFEACITLSDLAAKLTEVPVFAQVAVRHVIEGGVSIHVASVLMLDSDRRVRDPVSALGTDAEAFLGWFNSARDRLIPPDAGLLSTGASVEQLDEADILAATIRTAVGYVVAPLLPVSSRLRLVDGRRAGIYLRLCVTVAATYFRSEVELAVRDVMSARPGQFFDQAKFGFGEPFYLSDLQEALMALDGVEGVIVTRMQIAGRPETEATGTGILRPPPNTALTLDPDNPGPETGYYVLQIRGGLVG